MTDGPDRELDVAEARVHLLYQECAKVAAHFWEWRHKVMLICTTVLALVVASTSFIYREGLGGGPMAFPLLAGSGVAFMCAGFDRRNAQIMDACYRFAADLERGLWRERAAKPWTPGVFSAIQASRESDYPLDLKKGSYGWVLRRAYLGLGWILVLLAIAAIGIAVESPDRLVPARQDVTNPVICLPAGCTVAAPRG